MIRDNCQERFRTLLYRRLMFRVAEKLAEYLKDEALVTIINENDLEETQVSDNAPTD